MAGNTVGDRLVRGWGWLDGVAAVFQAIVGGFYRLPGTRWIKDLLHGTLILHHPLHPAVTDVAVGGYTVLAALDVLFLWQRDASLLRATDTVLVGSLAFSLISTLSGLTDWKETSGNEKRLGILHGLLMLTATVGFVISLWMRVALDADARTGAIYLSLASLAVVLVASHLGGEMAFGYGTGVNRQAWTRIGSKWETLELRASAIDDQAPVEAKLKNGTSLFVVKVDGAVHAMANTCTHAGCSLHKGTLVGRDRREIQCPCHGSVFDVRSGTVIHGPATMSEPAFETRVTDDGSLEVKLRT